MYCITVLQANSTLNPYSMRLFVLIILGFYPFVISNAYQMQKSTTAEHSDVRNFYAANSA